MAKPIEPGESPVDRLGKLLPSEVTGLYVAMRAFFVDPTIPNYGYYLIGLAIVCFFIGMGYIFYIRNVRNILHLVIYGAAFAVWAFSLDVDHIKVIIDRAIGVQLALPQIAGALSILISFIFPFFISNETLLSPAVRAQPAPSPPQNPPSAAPNSP